MKKANIVQNKKIHDKLANTYNIKHTEIYNKVEQRRLEKSIHKIIKLSKAKNELNKYNE